MAVQLQLETSVHIERHYAVTEIAEMWNLSADKVREIFENEPGVLVIGERNPGTSGVMLRCEFRSLCWSGFTGDCHRKLAFGRSTPQC